MLVIDDKEREFFEDNADLANALTQDLKPLSEIFDLTGKTAIVVGGACGLGYNVVYRLAEAGANVIIGDNEPLFGENTVKELKEFAFDVDFFEMDLRDVDSIQAMIDYVEGKYGSIDICVDCAARWNLHPFLDMTEEEYDEVVDIVQKGTFFLGQRVARSMIRKGVHGKIVNIASVAALSSDTPYAMLSHYNTAKAGVVTLTKAMARELKQYGILVNCVAPGGMPTAGAARTMNGVYENRVMDDGVDEQAVIDKWVASAQSIPQCDSPDEVALVVFSLCTDMANFMVGETVFADGGATLAMQNIGKLPRSIR